MADLSILEPGPLAEVGRAIRARMEQAFPAPKFTVQWMPARVDREVWQELMRRPPMIGIGFNGFARPETTGTLNVVSRWTVYVASKNPRGNEAALFGDKLEPGQLALAEVAAAMLHAWKVPDFGTVVVHEANNSFVEDYKDPGLAITAIELTVPADLSIGKVLGGDLTQALVLTDSAIQWSFDGSTIALTDINPAGTT